MHKKYRIELILFLSYAVFAMSWIGATEFMVEIMQQSHMTSLAEASILSSALLIAKVVGAFLAVYLMHKVGIYWAFAIALAMICFSIITPLATNFLSLFASRFIMGLGGALILVYFNPIVFILFARRELALVNGLNLCAFNFGMILIAYIRIDLVNFFGSWQLVLIVLSLISLLLCFMWLLCSNISELDIISKVKQEHKDSFLSGFKHGYVWHYALTFAGLISLYFVLFTFYQYARIVSIKELGIWSLVGTVIGIICSQGLVKHLVLIRLSAILQLVSLTILNFNHDPLMMKFSAILLSLVLSLPLPAMVTFVHNRANMTSQQLGMIFSLVYAISYLIATVVVFVFAKLVDFKHGDFTSAFIFICLINSMFLIGSLFLRENKVSAQAAC